MHLGLGLGLNLVGTAIAFIANAWLTFMMSPNGISSQGAVLSVWDAIYNYTWMPINGPPRDRRTSRSADRSPRRMRRSVPAVRHRRGPRPLRLDGIHRQLRRDQRVSPAPLRRLLARERDYAFSQTLGLTMMGGAFSWLFIIQAVLIGNLFLAANYYLWLGMGRVGGPNPLQKFIKHLLIGIALCFMVWATPRSIIATVSEIRAMGVVLAPDPRLSRSHVRQEHGRQHPDPHDFHELPALPPDGQGGNGVVGEEGAHRAARDLRRRRGIRHLPGRLRYFVEATSGSGSQCRRCCRSCSRWSPSPPSTSSCSAAQHGRGRCAGAGSRDPQYVLIFIAVTFTWLMGLMGYVRSGLRQHWHVR